MDSLRSAEVVTADGRLVTASAGEHPDLFWALRGGGPSFGVVVELELALHPVGPAVTGGLLGWPIEHAGDVAAAYTALLDAAPDDLGGALALFNAPPAPFVPEPLRAAALVAVAVLWTGDEQEGAALLAPLRGLAPAFDAVRRMPYAALQGRFESPERFTARVHGEGGFLTGLTAETVAVLAEQHARKPAPLGNLLLQPLGGAFAAWAGGLRAALAPWSGGESFPNFIPPRDPERLRAAYGEPTWERLRAIRPTGIRTPARRRSRRPAARRAPSRFSPIPRARISALKTQ